jgi:hypothetical protein
MLPEHDLDPNRLVPATDNSRGRGLGSSIDLILIATGLVLLAIRPTTTNSFDAYARYQALLGFLATGLPPDELYAFIGPVFAAPLGYLGRLFPNPGTEWFVLRYNLLLFVLLLLGLWALLRNRLDRQLLRTFLLILVTASLFGYATQDFLGEMFTAVLVGLGIVVVVLRRRLAGWVLLAVGTANTPAAGVGLGLLALSQVLRRRRLRYLAVVPAAAVLMILDLRVFRRGHAVSSNYIRAKGFRTILPYSGRPGFSYPLPFGLMSIMFSFGKGLVFFAPGLLIPARRLLRRLDPSTSSVYVLWLVFLAGMILVYSAWWAWYGGFTWGPRFFLLASLPASLALAARLRYPPRHWVWLLALFGALLLSCWVGVNGLVYDTANTEVCSANQFANESLCWYVPEFSVLWRPFVVPKTSYTELELAFLAYTALALARLSVPLVGPSWRAAKAGLSPLFDADEVPSPGG